MTVDIAEQLGVHPETQTGRAITARISSSSGAESQLRHDQLCLI